MLKMSVYSSSGNMKFTPYNDANEVTNEPYESLHSKYEVNLEPSMA